jgi:hypothetical protein
MRPRAAKFRRAPIFLIDFSNMRSVFSSPPGRVCLSAIALASSAPSELRAQNREPAAPSRWTWEAPRLWTAIWFSFAFAARASASAASAAVRAAFASDNALCAVLNAWVALSGVAGLEAALLAQP